MPPRHVGTLSLDDLLARRDVTPLQLGLDIIQTVLTRDQAAHNRVTQDMISKYAVISTDIRRRYGVSDTLDFARVDEFGRSHTQKVVTSSVVEFPLERYQAAVGWTADFFRAKTVADLAMTQVAAQNGHVLNIRARLQAAIYGASNYTFTDYLDTGIDVGVKRFVNADGAPIPNGPNGETFNASSHTHYLFSNGLTDVGAQALVDTVMEHHSEPRVYIYINRADEVSWRALTNFKPYIDNRISIALTTTGVPNTQLDPYNPNDREIGLYSGAIIAVKPWAISNYASALDLGANTPKPLVARVRNAGDGLGLRTVADNVMFPLQAQFMQAEFGFGVWERTAGAVLYHATSASAYVDPAVVSAP